MSRPRLKILSNVIERLHHIPEPTLGYLYGCLYDNCQIVIGFTIDCKNKKDAGEDKENIGNLDFVPHLPTEVDLCGVFQITSSNKDVDVLELGQSLSQIDVTDNPVVLSSVVKGDEVKGQFFIHNKLEDTCYDIITETDINNLFVYVRLEARLQLSCEFLVHSLQDSLAVLKKKVVGGCAAFRISNANIYLTGNDVDCVSGSPAIQQLLPGTEEPQEGATVQAGRRKSPLKQVDCLSVELFMKDDSSDLSSKCAPVISCVKREFNSLKIPLNIDVISMVNRMMKVPQLYSILVESVCRNLRLNEQCLVAQMKQQNSISLPRFYHFLPPDCGHFVTLPYPVKAKDDDTLRTRQTLHEQLCLPTDRPYFRQSCAYSFNEESSTNCPLLNPHEGLPASGVVDGETAIVQGTYSYHHYMQDKFDDNGWGCAYRSLQTLFSWFRFQGYTNKPVPSHKDIQKCLVDIGDKPSSFMGTNQWIGSTEVSFCLDTLLGVSCRIVALSSGEEMSTKGGELVHHFKTQGTPVMIGGGVLAHTIIGVDYNKRTGSIKFLVLDPHYTGGEDLRIIQSKGWCGWKGLEFWRKDSFYNMCLPIRPKCI